MRYVWGIAGLVVLAELVMAPHYGPHRDELYFVAAGHHLAWGYPDQPSLVALLARLADLVAPHSLLALRTPSALAVGGVVVLAGALARELGGSDRGVTTAALLTGTGVLTLVLGHRLTTQTLSMLAWTAVVLLAARALHRDRPRLWLLAGLVAGVGLNAKHDLVVLLGGLLLGIVATAGTRHHLRSPWLWAGGLLALALWVPNLVWQATHGWPVLRLGADIRNEYGGPTGALLYAAMALLVMSPLMSLVWLRGTAALLREDRWVLLRPVAWSSVFTFVFFLLTGGKAYYLAGALVPLLAAGAVLVAERVRRWLPVVAVLVLSAAVAWPAGTPVLPAHTYASSFYPAIDADQLETIGWPQLAAAVRREVAGEPAGTVVLTGNYGEAGALEWYGVGAPVYSGHNGFADWGPPPDDAGPVVVIGYRDPSEDFTGCEVRGVVPRVDGADNEEAGTRIYACEAPRRPWSQLWPDLTHLDA